MSEFEPTPSLSLREAALQWSRDHTVGVVFAVLGLLVAAMLQISLIGGWHFGLPDVRIPIAPMNASVTSTPSTSESMLYSFASGPAVSATRTINIATDRVLGVRIALDRIPPETRLTLGWVGVRDRRRPTNLVVPLPASDGPIVFDVPLRGHGEWRDNAIQFAVILSAPPGSPPVALSRAEWIAATPLSSVTHAWQRWSGSPSIVAVDSTAVRVLPLAAFVGVAALLAFAALAWLRRDEPARRRNALVGGFCAFAVALLPLALIAISDWRWSYAAGGSVLAALALSLALLATRATRLTLGSRWLAVYASALAVAAAAIAVGGWPLSWVVLAVLLAMLGQRWPSVFSKLRATLFWLPLLILGALSQAIAANRVSLPGVALRDPSTTLAASLQHSAPFMALLFAFVLCVLFLPSQARRSRDGTAALVGWFALVGTVLGFSLLIVNAGASWSVLWWLPLAVCVTAWLIPAFQSRIVSTSVVAAGPEKTEDDLSEVVRQLFDGAAQSFDNAIAEGRLGNALGPLNRMREIAPGSLRTKAGEINYALRGTNLHIAANAYRSLLEAPRDTLETRAPGALSLLLAYANRTRDFARVIALLENEPPTEANARLLARAVLLSARADAAHEARDRALSILQAVAKPNGLAHEIAELHLLADDWQSAQQALVDSPITPQSLPGQIYVARLGFLATGGNQTYVDQIQKFATWHSDLELAQFAMGEMLLRQGNLQGARARLALVAKQDITLWAAERRVIDIDHALAAASDSRTQHASVAS